MSLLNQNLQAFVAIVETNTVHGAAKKIGLSQTGVTQRIRALESSLGVTVFTRSRKGMSLTREGESLYRYCIKAIELEGETLSQIDPLRYEQTIRVNITAPSSMMRSRVIPSTSKVLERFPNIVMTYSVADDSSGPQNLKNGISQLAILYRHEVSNELDSKLLRPEEYVLAVPYSWRKMTLEDIVTSKRVVDFNPTDEFTINYLKQYGVYKHFKNERHFANNTDAITSLITAGQGYSVLSKKFAEPFVKDKSIYTIKPKQVYNVDFALAWYPRAQMPSYLRELIDSIK